MGVKITELTGTDTGGAPILSYHVQYDQAGGGTGPWTDVAGDPTDSLSLEHTIGALLSGKMYYFRYRARNVHGWSEEFSPV